MKIKNLIYFLLFIALFLIGISSPQLTSAQVSLQDCGALPACADKSVPRNLCWSNTTPSCQFGCRASFQCPETGNDGCKNQGGDAYCQNLAGETAPNHPCAGSCDTAIGNGACVSTCPFCVLQPPRPTSCGDWGCPGNQMAYVQDSNWSDNGESCNNTHRVSCEADPSCNAPLPPPGSGGGGPTHLGCSGGSCQSIAGVGTDDCSACTTSGCQCNPSNYKCGTDLNKVPGCDPSGTNSCSPGNACSAGQSCSGGIGGSCTGGGGGGGGGCTLENGEGCGAGIAGCCKAGFTCNSSGGTTVGTCRGPGGSVCKLPAAHLIYPIAPDSLSVLTIPGPNMVYGSGTNPPMQWSTADDGINGNNSADCTFSHDGTYAYLFIDNQAVQYVEAPGYNPSPWSTFPNDPNWNPGQRMSTNANSTDPSMVNTAKPYLAPFTPTPGIIHTWNIQYLSPNGNYGGTRNADNWNLGRFIIKGGPPNPPIPICQRTSGDPYTDLCNTPDSWSFAGPLRHSVSILDGGPDSTTVYTHNFTILDITSCTPGNPGPCSPTLVTNITNVPGLGGSVVNAQFPAALLTNGHTYSWFANSSDPANPGTLINQTVPQWQFVYSTAGPTVVPEMTYGKCYASPQTPNNPPPLQLFVSDTIAGVQSSSVTISDNGVPSSVPLSFDPSQGGNPNSGKYNAKWPPLAVGHTYGVLDGNATNNAGNSTTVATPNMNFLFSSACTSPWLQTKEGDVHSNQGINTPGGP